MIAFSNYNDRGNNDDEKGLLAGALTATVLFGTCAVDVPGIISPKPQKLHHS